MSGIYRLADSIAFYTLRRLTARPRPFESERRQFWADPYISKYVLRAHLDEHTDAGTRRGETVRASSEWIAEQWDLHGTGKERTPVMPESAPRLLDLGCGPGLYDLEFQHLGLHVTGIDIAPAAIEYARQACRISPRHAQFVNADYLEDRFTDTYDIVTCIYGGVATISDKTRGKLFSSVFDALNPGGLLVFDVLTRAYVDSERLRDGWFVLHRGGFWSPKPYVVLEKSHLFETESACADSYTLLFDDGTADRFLIWHRYYTDPEIRSACNAAGFEVLSMYSDLCGTPQYAGSHWLGVLARKPPTSSRSHRRREPLRPPFA